MSLTKRINQEGIGLIEIIISLGVAIIIVTAMVSLAIFTINASNQSQLLMEATRMSNQQMERIRAVRDRASTWDSFYNDLNSRTCPEDCQGSACYVNSSFQIRQNTSPPTSPKGGIEACFYVESVSDPEVEDNQFKVVTVATWMDGGERKFTHNYSLLTNWQH